MNEKDNCVLSKVSLCRLLQAISRPSERRRERSFNNLGEARHERRHLGGWAMIGVAAVGVRVEGTQMPGLLGAIYDDKLPTSGFGKSTS